MHRASQLGFLACTGQVPGETVARQRLEQPGPFSLHASVQGSSMYLMAYALGQATKTWECEAGASSSLSVDDHGDITVVLVPGSCPALE